MNRGDFRTSWMKDKRYSRGEEFRPFSQRNLGGEFRRQITVNRGKVDTRLFENGAVLENTRSAATASFANPGIFAKFLSTDILDGVRDFVL